MENQKMRKTAGVLNKIFRVLQRVIVIGMAAAVLVTAVLTVVNRLNPDAVIGQGFTSLELGPVDLKLDSQYAPDNSEMLTFCWILLALAATHLTALWFTLKYVREILEPMEQGNPFHKNTAGNIRRLAWIQLAMGIVGNLVEAAAAHAAVKQWHLMDLVQTEGIQEVSVNASGNFNFVLVFFGLLLLSYIFSYGAALQQQADETL